MPEGHRPKAEEPAGLWRGETLVFPRDMSWPAKLELRLSRKGEDWQGELRISFPNSWNDTATQVTDFRLTDTGISSNPMAWARES